MDFQKLNLLFKCNKEFSHKKIRIKELSDTECMICSYIYAHENCSQENVASALKADKTTVGKALAMLEKKNCVIRIQDTADKRIKRLTLTNSGKDKISELVNIHNNWLDEIMKCLSEKEQERFEDYCERLLNSAEKLIKKGGRKNNG